MKLEQRNPADANWNTTSSGSTPQRTDVASILVRHTAGTTLTIDSPEQWVIQYRLPVQPKTYTVKLSENELHNLGQGATWLQAIADKAEEKN